MNCSGSTSMQSYVLSFTTSAYRTSGVSENNGDIVLTDGNINVFPNAVKIGESINFSGNQLPKEASIYSLEGKILLRKQMTENYLILPMEITPGIYFLKTNFDDGNSITTKLIVQ